MAKIHTKTFILTKNLI